MKKIKMHLGFIFSLVSLLLSIGFCVAINGVLLNYEREMKNSYSIVISSKNGLDEESLIKNMPSIKSLTLIDPQDSLEKIRLKMEKSSFANLQKKLPKFYSIKLNYFPNSKELKNIEHSLKKTANIDKVEVFSEVHNNVYKVLVILKFIIYVFSIIVILLGLSLILKQIRIWILEHKERIEIISIFGGTFIYKSLILYRMAFIDSLISTLISITIFYNLPKVKIFSSFIQEVGLMLREVRIFNDTISLFLIALILSFASVTYVMLSIEDEQ